MLHDKMGTEPGQNRNREGQRPDERKNPAAPDTERRLSPRPPPLPARPFERIGLRANPFRVVVPAEVMTGLIEPSLTADVERILTGPATAVEVVGGAGWGKSTWLAAFRHIGINRLRQTWAWTYVQPSDRRIGTPAGPFDGWCIDEAQRLAPRALRRLMRRSMRGGVRLVLGTHVSVAVHAQLAGAPLRSILLRRPDAAVIQTLVDRRTAAVCAPGTRPPRIAPAALDLLLLQSAGNLHRVEEIMYEVFQAYARRAAVPASVSEADIDLAIQRRASS